MSTTTIPAALPRFFPRPFSQLLSVVSFRFTLRELLLGMLVCAALAAWVHERRERNQPLHQSHIAEYFATKLQKDIRAARAETGETGEPWSFAPPSCWEMTGIYQAEHCLNREWFCYLHLPWEKSLQFHEDLVRRIDSHIRRGKTGEYVGTEEYEGGTAIHTSDFFGDSTKYHCGNIHGTIRVYLHHLDAKHALFIAISNEHRVP